MDILLYECIRHNSFCRLNKFLLMVLHLHSQKEDGETNSAHADKAFLHNHRVSHQLQLKVGHLEDLIEHLLDYPMQIEDHHF